MDAVLRAGAIYIALMVLFRISGRRSLGEMTSFDFVLLLIIGEATQQALLGDDFSVTNAVLVIVTLLSIDIGFSLLKRRSKRIGKLIDGGPTIVVENGTVLATPYARSQGGRRRHHAGCEARARVSRVSTKSNSPSLSATEKSPSSPGEYAF
jgi:uncharacterized membrane protein YcaP (DUF421 family)